MPLLVPPDQVPSERGNVFCGAAPYVDDPHEPFTDAYGCPRCGTTLAHRHPFCHGCWRTLQEPRLASHCWACRRCGRGPHTGAKCDGSFRGRPCVGTRADGIAYTLDTLDNIMLYYEAWLRATALHAQFMLALCQRAVQRISGFPRNPHCRFPTLRSARGG